MADLWLGLGALIGRHMVVVAPACVALGVAFPGAFSWMSPAVGALFAFMTFQNALSTTSRELLAVLRHPAPLLCSLVILVVVMPLAALGAGSLLVPGDHDVIAGMVLECCVPMGVTGLMWTDVYGGNRPLALAVVVASTVLAPFTMPLAMQLLMGASVRVDVAGMMVDLLLMVALPALAGMLCNDLSHGAADVKAAPWLAPAAKVMLVVILLANSTRVSDAVRHLTPELLGVAAAMACLSALGYVLGYVAARLLHRDVGDCLTMGVTSGARNITSGAVLAAAYFPETTMFPVIMGTLFQHVVAGLFGWAVRRFDGRCRLDAAPGLPAVGAEAGAECAGRA